MTRKDDKGDQPSGGETTWTNTGATPSGRGQHKTGSLGGMLRPLPNHKTLRLPNDDDDLSNSRRSVVILITCSLTALLVLFKCMSRHW